MTLTDQPAGGQTARLGNLLGALSLALADRMQGAVEGAAGQTSSAPAALVALSDMVSAGSVDQLRRALALTPSGAVRLVDRLVAAGLAERRPGRDARSLSVVLTPQGRRAAEEVRRARAAAVTSALEALDHEERDVLLHLAEKLVQTVTVQRLAERASGVEPRGGWLCRMCDLSACGRHAGTCPAAMAAAPSNRSIRGRTDD